MSEVVGLTYEDELSMSTYALMNRYREARFSMQEGLVDGKAVR